MDIVVVVKQVPDLVEELTIAADGARLDPHSLKLKVNEFDEHALEEGLLLKEAQGGKVTVVALESDGLDETLFTALAKGADRAVKVTGDFSGGVSSHAAASMLGEVIKGLPYDVILTGVQSAEDRDGQIGPLLACALGIPHVSVVTGVKVEGKAATIQQEYAGGIVGEMEVDLPAVFGIQAAQKPPRYVPVSKVRQAMKASRIESLAAPEAPMATEAGAGGRVRRMFKPESGSRATMIEGGPEEQVDRLLSLLREKGFLK
jgi:electron transfer flavoprotein beta subunit